MVDRTSVEHRSDVTIIERVPRDSSRRIIIGQKYASIIGGNHFIGVARHKNQLVLVRVMIGIFIDHRQCGTLLVASYEGGMPAIGKARSRTV